MEPCNFATGAGFFGAMNTLTSLSKKGRLIAVMPVLALALFSGCMKSPEARTVDAAAKRYGHVKVGMSKEDVLAKLGEPANKQELRYRWETVAGRDFNASLEVRFDAADEVVSVARSRASTD